MKNSKPQQSSSRETSTIGIQSLKSLTCHLKFGASLVVGASLLVLFSDAFAQSTAFTYQGQLQNNGSPANGTYNLQFSLYTNSTGGTAMAGPVTNDAVTVSNGIFTVIIDFGGAVWNGATNWLQIGVETNGAASFSSLAPRQQVSPSPYSIFAEGANAAGLSGTVPMSSLSGIYGGALSFTNPADSFTGNGSGLANVNAVTLDGLAAGNFWQAGGNSGVLTGSNFIGNNDNQYLDIHANGVRVFRLRLFTDGLGLYTNAPNVIGGSSVNLVGPNVVGATIAGGGGNDTNGDSLFNEVYADFGTIGGGASNRVFSVGGTVSGGAGNVATNLYAMVGGGAGNYAGGIASFVGGGGTDGSNNGGNIASGDDSVICGGLKNVSAATDSVISGGSENYITTNGVSGSIGGGFKNVASASYSTIAGGGFNSAVYGGSTVAGGEDNQAINVFSTVCGGNFNIANGNLSIVGGGDANDASGDLSVIAGGLVNTNSAIYSAICGGCYNYVGGEGSFIGGGGYDGVSFSGNYIAANAATICGGAGNNIPSGSRYAFIGGGLNNEATAYYATVGGGLANAADGTNSTVPGGYNNSAAGGDSFAAGTFAIANFNGSFVWSDESGTFAEDTGVNQFVARASGGYSFYTGVSSGASLASGATSWTILCDRNAKKNFKPVDTVAVLDKLASVPIEQWNYKWEKDNDTPNIGPMAQDFKKAFYPGRDDKGITTLEFDGVELAAIQGLNQKLQEQQAENAQLKEELNELKMEVKSLEQMKGKKQ